MRDVGLLSTSKIYTVDDRIFIFTPQVTFIRLLASCRSIANDLRDFQFTDWQRFYLTHDINILLDVMKSELFYVKTSWNVPGRPLICVTLSRAMIFRESFGFCELFKSLEEKPVDISF